MKWYQRDISKVVTGLLLAGVIVIGISVKVFGQTDSNSDNAIRHEMASMSLEQKVGQLFFINIDARYHHNQSGTFRRWSKRIKEYHVGGLSVYGGNMYAAAQNIKRLQHISDRPLLVASTLEWGLPMRVKAGTRFPENMALAATRNPDYAYRQGKIVAREMRAAGFHVNFAPVVDVNNNPDNPIINVRSYGESPALVSFFARHFILGLQEGGIAATAKHFPGHGDTNLDSHLELPSVPVSRARLDSVELPPFAAAIRAGAEVVMSAHIALPRLPSGKQPATLSHHIQTGILRNSLGFKGLIVTDALNMGGIINNYAPGEAAVRAIQAGTDMILFSPHFEKAYMTVLRAVNEDYISEERIDESVHRILKLKKKLKIEENRYPDMQQINGVLEHPQSKKLAKLMFRESITLVKDPNHAVPLDSAEIDSAAVIILTDEIRHKFPGDPFIDEIKKRAGTINVFRMGPDPSDELLAEASRAVSYSDVALLGMFVQFRDHKGSIGLPKKQVDWLNQLARSKSPPIVVGFGNPYLLRYFTKIPVYMATFSVAETSQRITVEGLFGESSITGKLPVTLSPDYPFGHGLLRKMRR